MSGRDERKISKLPRCLLCNGESDIIIKYSNNVNAGWILSDNDRKWLGVPIVLNDRYSASRMPMKAYCLGCWNIVNPVAVKELEDNAIKFFMKQIQACNYITWEVYSERNKRERH